MKLIRLFEESGFTFLNELISWTSKYTIYFADRFLRKKNLVVVLFVNTFFNLLIMLVIAWVGVGIFYMDGNFKLMIGHIQNLFGYY